MLLPHRLTEPSEVLVIMNAYYGHSDLAWVCVSTLWHINSGTVLERFWNPCGRYSLFFINNDIAA